MLHVTGRIGIVAVGIGVPDPAIGPMDHDLAALTDSPAAGGLDRIRLGPMGGPDPVGALAAGAEDLTSAAQWGPVAATGAWLHGRAANVAAGRYGLAGGPITALDVADALPAAVGEVIAAAPA